MPDHETLVERAKEAIDTVHGDKSVSLDETLDSLDELQGHVEMLMAAIREDIERAEAGSVGEDESGEEGDQ